MLQKLLQNIGLSDKEVLVYLQLIETGTGSAFDLSKQTDMPSSTIYVMLRNLEQKGLVTRGINKKTAKFYALEPENLYKYLNSKQTQIINQRQELDRNFSQLTALFQSRQDKPIFKLYTGQDGLQALEQDANQIDGVVAPILYAFTPLDIMNDLNLTSSTADYRLQRKQHLKVIYTHKDGIQNFTDRQLLREARFLPRQQFPFNSGIVIAPNHSVRMYSYKNGFIGVWIENLDMANSLKTIFDLCWKNAQKEK